MKVIKLFHNVFWIKGIKRKKILATLNNSKGFSVYGEKLIKYNGKEYREWIPKRSKLASAIYKGLKNFAFKEDSTVLYLGIASGTTASHVSDICNKGLIFGIDISPRVLRECIYVSERKKNIFPILCDASNVKNYKFVGKVDIIYQDIAQKDQGKIFIKNVKEYLKDGGTAYIAIKARSIDVTKDPRTIFRGIRKEIESAGLKVIEEIRLDPFQKDHAMMVVKK